MSNRNIILPAIIATVLIISLFVYPSIEKPIGAAQTKFTGTEDHHITLQEGIELTRAYRMSAPSDAAVLGRYFGKAALTEALAQPGCVGLRMYYAKHKDGSPTLVVVGVDHDGVDMIAGVLLQKGFGCTPGLDCARSLLNQDNTFATLK